MRDQIVEAIGEDRRVLLDRVGEEVFMEEYHQLIHDGIRSYLVLKHAGFSTEETIAILIQEPFTRWKKVTRRLIAEQPTEELSGDEEDFEGGL